MGEYTSNYSLYLPAVGETGWGNLVNQNFVLIDQNLPITANDGSKWFVNNASYDKTTDTWTQIDTAKGSSAIHLRNDGYGEALTCVAGNGVITWSESTLDMKNVYSSTGNVDFRNCKIVGQYVKLTASKTGQILLFDHLSCYSRTAGGEYRTLSCGNKSGNYGIRFPSNLQENSSIFVEFYAGGGTSSSSQRPYRLIRKNSDDTIEILWETNAENWYNSGSYYGDIDVHANCELYFQIDNNVPDMHIKMVAICDGLFTPLPLTI